MHKKILYTLLLFCSCLIMQLNAQQTSRNVLNTNIDINYGNITISNLLDSIHYHYKIDFSYNPSIVPTDSLVLINNLETPLSSLLKNILSDFEFETIGDQIIISKKTESLKKVNENSSITINGTIACLETDKPIQNANISVFGYPLGTITNANGEFTFVIPDSLTEEQIVISSVGYEKKQLPIPKADSTIYSLLSRSIITIKEVKIRNIKAEDVINECLQNIDKNYINNDQLLTAFFREIIKQDDQYIDVAEAVLHIDKSRYADWNDDERVKFIKGRKIKNEDDVSIARLKLAGGPAVFAKLDIVKHQNFFNTPNSETNYSYKFIGYEIEHDNLVYKIAFKPIVTEDNLYYEGELFIDTKSFALSSAVFRMTKKSLKNSADYLVKQHAKKVRSTPFFTEYKVSYRPINNKWILNKVSGEIKIKLSDKRNKHISVYHAISELLITNSELNLNSIKSSETFKTHYILADKIKSHDADFWKNYNIIRPEKELENVFKTPIEIRLVPAIKKPDLKPGF